MSSRNNHCTSCGQIWFCEGCETGEVDEVCSSCLVGEENGQSVSYLMEEYNNRAELIIKLKADLRTLQASNDILTKRNGVLKARNQELESTMKHLASLLTGRLKLSGETKR